MMTVDESSGVRLALEARARGFERDYAAHDAEALVGNYFAPDSEGPIASPPGGQKPIAGRAALIEMFRAQFAMAPAIRLEIIDVQTSGDLAFELGRAFLTLADGATAIGRYTVCWIKIAGEWLAKIDFFTADGWED